MHRYGIVIFHKGGETGAKLKKLLVEEMNSAGVITVSETQINTWYEEDLKELFTTSHKFMLHNRREIDIFKNVASGLKLKDPSIEYCIRLFEPDKKLRKWFRAVEKRRKLAEK